MIRIARGTLIALVALAAIGYFVSSPATPASAELETTPTSNTLGNCFADCEGPGGVTCSGTRVECIDNQGCVGYNSEGDVIDAELCGLAV